MCPGDGRRPRRELAFYFPVTAGAAPQRGASDVNNPDGVEVTGPAGPRYDEILTPQALSLVAALQRELGPRRAELLAARVRRQAELSAGGQLDFLAATAAIRADKDW